MMNNALQPLDYQPSVHITDTPFWEDEAPVSDLYTEDIVVDAEPLSLPGISVNDFMRHTMTYEDQPVEFAARLRQGALAGMALTLAGALSLALLPALYSAVFASALILFFRPFLSGYIQFLANTPLLNYIDGALLSSSLVLLCMTRGLHRGRPLLHWLAFAEAIGGTANLLMIAIPLLIISLNIVSWIVIIVALILIVALIVAVLVALM